MADVIGLDDQHPLWGSTHNSCTQAALREQCVTAVFLNCCGAATASNIFLH